jgi:hypothetical protein
MTRARIAFLSLLSTLFVLVSTAMVWSGSSSPALATGGVNCTHCVPSRGELPASWRPTRQLQKRLNPAPWSRREARDAEHAVYEGLDEMVSFYEQRPSALKTVREDVVESLVEVTYASEDPDLSARARGAARRNLTKLMAPYLRRAPASVRCAEYPSLLPLAIYAGATSSHVRLAPEDPRTATMARLTNSAYHACGTVEAAIGYNYKPLLANIMRVSVNDVSELAIWSQWFIEAQLVPGLDVPADVRSYPAAFWRALQRYPLVGAKAYPDGARNDRFYRTAYLATHIGYLITGDDRHPLYVEDSPALYRFLRENFYAVMEMGELDLTAEFVDDLRQYGCTEENDQQVRDGTRYLLTLYHSAGGHWMAYREPSERGQKLEDYDLIHKAWTGLEGLRMRDPEPPARGTYGGVVRTWLPHPR